jgi:hypothetical protein
MEILSTFVLAAWYASYILVPYVGYLTLRGVLHFF